MSDVSKGSGWWLATDGKWYAPELHPVGESKTEPAPGAINALPTFDVGWTATPSGQDTFVPPTIATTASTNKARESFAAEKRSRRPRWIRWSVPIGALLIVVVAASLAISNSVSTSGWKNQSLHVVGSPVASGNLVIVLNVTPEHELEMSAVRPTNGSIVWSHPYSASEITPGVAFSPIAIGSTVLVLAPANGPSNPNVSVEGVDASTGNVLWKVPQQLVLSDAPVVCAADEYFCIPVFVSGTATALVAVNSSTGTPVGAVQGPNRNMAVAPPGSTNFSTLWQTSDSIPTLLQTSTTGQQQWTESVASLFGGNQYNPNYGWDFLVKGPLDIGSIGVSPNGDTEPLDEFKTIGISTSSGSVEWTVPGYYLCGGGLQFLTVDLVCRYTGSAQANGTMSGVSLTLEGLNATLGATTWSQPVLDAEALSLGTNIAFADGTHIVVAVSSGRRMVLDVANGSLSPISNNEVFWCEELPYYKVNTPQGASADGKRAGEPEFRACSASGTTESGQPLTEPSTVGLSLDGMFIWPGPSGLQAVRSLG